MVKQPSAGYAWVGAQLVLWILQLSLPGWWRPAFFPEWAWGPAFLGWELAAAVACGLGGAWLAVAAVLALGVNLTPLPRPKADSVLVVRGPYRVLRHPIYSALVLLFLGWALAWRHPALLALDGLLFVLLLLKSRVEERWLLARYPDYLRYRTRTGALLPRVPRRLF